MRALAGAAVLVAIAACSSSDPPPKAVPHRASAAPCLIPGMCGSDADCKGIANICACSDMIGLASQCAAQGDCAIDADCTGGHACSPSLVQTCDVPLSISMHCRTPNDECVVDADCPQPGFAGASTRCSYDSATARWRCTSFGCEG